MSAGTVAAARSGCGARTFGWRPASSTSPTTLRSTIASAAQRRQPRWRAVERIDPVVAERFADIAPSLFHRLEAEPIWEAVLAAEPAPHRHLSDVDVDAVAESIAKFVDLRSTYTLGHSSAVSRLAEGAARRLGLGENEARTIRRAGLLHDLGRLGVPVAVWERTDPWGEPEWERARRHPALTELVLARSTTLGPIGTLAGLHHERLDGSGYRGVTAAAQPLAARVLAVADAYQTKLERRPHRAAVAPEVAATHLRDEGSAERLDAEVVGALLDSAGRRPATPRPAEPPAPLSQREVEVLRLLARGLSNREMAEVLIISPKTVGHHVQHIYDKLGISTRVGATLFALQHGIVGDETPK
jgi:HD-GYP domain-containing protein (c-di-GMP phosphodiesterase class II)